MVPIPEQLLWKTSEIWLKMMPWHSNLDIEKTMQTKKKTHISIQYKWKQKIHVNVSDDCFYFSSELIETITDMIDEWQFFMSFFCFCLIISYETVACVWWYVILCLFEMIDIGMYRVLKYIPSACIWIV